MRIRILAPLAAIALCFTVPALAGTSSGYGKGGQVKEFASEVDRQNQSGELFRIKGHCQSACTMFLAVSNVCVEPSARLLFHAGSNANATSRMLNSYNSQLRSYLEARGAMSTPAFHTISGSDMIRKFGYPACPR